MGLNKKNILVFTCSNHFAGARSFDVAAFFPITVIEKKAVNLHSVMDCPSQCSCTPSGVIVTCFLHPSSSSPAPPLPTPGSGVERGSSLITEEVVAGFFSLAAFVLLVLLTWVFDPPCRLNSLQFAFYIFVTPTSHLICVPQFFAIFHLDLLPRIFTFCFVFLYFPAFSLVLVSAGWGGG